MFHLVFHHWFGLFFPPSISTLLLLYVLAFVFYSFLEKLLIFFPVQKEGQFPPPLEGGGNGGLYPSVDMASLGLNFSKGMSPSPDITFFHCVGGKASGVS